MGPECFACVADRWQGFCSCEAVGSVITCVADKRPAWRCITLRPPEPNELENSFYSYFVTTTSFTLTVPKLKPMLRFVLGRAKDACS